MSLQLQWLIYNSYVRLFIGRQQVVLTVALHGAAGSLHISIGVHSHSKNLLLYNGVCTSHDVMSYNSCGSRTTHIGNPTSPVYYSSLPRVRSSLGKKYTLSRVSHTTHIVTRSIVSHTNTQLYTSTHDPHSLLVGRLCGLFISILCVWCSYCQGFDRLDVLSLIQGPVYPCCLQCYFRRRHCCWMDE
jgi:hypothetical protein